MDSSFSPEDEICFLRMCHHISNAVYYECVSIHIDCMIINLALHRGTDGSEELSRYSESLRAGRSGDRIPVGVRFSAPVQTAPGAHPASYTMGTGSFPWVKRPGRGVEHPLHIASRLKKEYRCNSTPTLGLRGLP